MGRSRVEAPLMGMTVLLPVEEPSGVQRLGGTQVAAALGLGGHGSAGAFVLQLERWCGGLCGSQYTGLTTCTPA